MSTVYEQTDGFVPNKQTPPATTKLGDSGAGFSEVHATSGNFTSMTIGTNERSVAGKFVTVGTIPATANGLLVTHNLNNAYPIVFVYDSNGSGIPHGSGGAAAVTGGYIAASSGANTLYLYGDKAYTSANIVVIG